jgi:hypothetical protein
MDGAGKCASPSPVLVWDKRTPARDYESLARYYSRRRTFAVVVEPPTVAALKIASSRCRHPA